MEQSFYFNLYLVLWTICWGCLALWRAQLAANSSGSSYVFTGASCFLVPGEGFLTSVLFWLLNIGKLDLILKYGRGPKGTADSEALTDKPPSESQSALAPEVIVNPEAGVTRRTEPPEDKSSETHETSQSPPPTQMLANPAVNGENGHGVNDTLPAADD